jgi:predicted acyltransferase
MASKNKFWNTTLTMTTSATNPEITSAPEKTRLRSLDIFRGATVAFMILVNTPGNDHTYAQLCHADWNGWTATDMVFPSFVFILGVSLVFSTGARLARGESRGHLLLHALRRAAILIALGLFINAFPHFVLHTWRIPGVLQRIAICYLVAEVLYLYVPRWTRWLLAPSLLVGYWWLMCHVRVPGVGLPGVNVPLLHPDLNLAAWLDRRLMMGHLYEGTRDPEGVLSTFPALVNALCGVFVGEWIVALRQTPGRLLGRLACCGVLCLAAGELWGLNFPINKKLWTSSYVLVSVGVALLLLTLCYWAFDVLHLRARWSRVFVVFGGNAIAAYFFSEVAASTLWVYGVGQGEAHVTLQQVIYGALFRWIRPLSLAGLAYSLAFVALCYLVVWVMDRKGIHLRA